ncbi:MFS transporter [Brevibacillus sp. LEMMJ03]|jgi:MFS transporter, YNFM family, putative membrane transport protein|uniref:MFS transporter n=1 Tax=Brevibacillus TaxID=55080 RepID=UPI00068F187D|nr:MULTISPECIES: MFS transporter [Brevibacillus]TRY24792.1 MFS transporter [Brevibacillus sp. LEMMJ03]
MARRQIIMFLATMNVFILLYAPQPLLPWLSDKYGISIATASLTISLTIIALAVSSLALAPLFDRWDRKKAIGIFCLLLIVPSAMLAITDSFTWILVWRVVHGLCIPGVTAVLVAYVSEEFPADRRGRALGAYVSATVAGGLVGRVIAGPIAEAFSWHAVFIATGFFSLLVTVLVWRYLPASQNQTNRAIGGFLAHFRNPALIGTFLIGFSQFFAFIGFFTYLPFYASGASFHLNATQISLLYFTYLFGIFSAPLAGYFSDRIGRRATMAFGHLIGASGILLTLHPSLPALLAGASILAFGNFASQSATTAYVTDVANGSRGAASSLYLFFFYVGGSLGAYIPGLLWSRYAWDGLVATTTCIIVLALLSNYFLAGKKKITHPANTTQT